MIEPRCGCGINPGQDEKNRLRRFEHVEKEIENVKIVMEMNIDRRPSEIRLLVYEYVGDRVEWRFRA